MITDFPPEIPKTGDLVRITPVQVDYVPRHYKFFCEESYVISRFFGTSYSGDDFCVEIGLGGTLIRKAIYNQKYQTWSISFDEQTIQVEVEKILE